MLSVHAKSVSPVNRSLFILFCLVIQMLCWQNCYGDDRAQAVKAAYLYNFAKFTRWSDLPENAFFHIQIIGSHPFGTSLSAIASKTIAGHPLQFSFFANYSPDHALHILFISRSHEAALPVILKSIAGREILTVSDITDFTEKGGMIGIVEKGNNIRFQINLDAARRVGLELSSQMLRLADSVNNGSSSSSSSNSSHR